MKYMEERHARMIRKFAIRLTKKAADMSIFSIDEFDIYVYAFEKSLSQLMTYSLLLLLGIIMNSLIYLIVYIIFLSMLRGQTSGYHAKSPIGCALLSCLVSAISIYLSNIVSNYIFIMPGLFISIVYILYRAPINHINLNLTQYEVERMQKSSRRMLLYEITLIILFYILPATRTLCIPASLSIITVALFMVLAKISNQEGKCYV